jgi:hypothetical protein
LTNTEYSVLGHFLLVTTVPLCRTGTKGHRFLNPSVHTESGTCICKSILCQQSPFRCSRLRNNAISRCTKFHFTSVPPMICGRQQVLTCFTSTARQHCEQPRPRLHSLGRASVVVLSRMVCTCAYLIHGICVVCSCSLHSRFPRPGRSEIMVYFFTKELD